MSGYNRLSFHKTMSRFLLTATVVIISLAGVCFPNPTVPPEADIKNVTTILPTAPLVRSTKTVRTITVTETPAKKESAKTTKVLVESTTASGRSTTRVQPSTKDVAKVARKQKSNVPVKGVAKLEERLGAVDCELPQLPHESRLWRGNETHELNLPITMTEECGVGVAEDECPPVVVSWEGSADIQSGDVLIVRIADSPLLTAALNNSALRSNTSHPDRIHRSPTQPSVYQVTRLGHEHCDISDGMMLDITPLAEQDAKIFTLYDKDLTEGVNLLIVVSENWGPQCVRLKVTVKSDNCGDSQDCSGKGVCYTNVSMEGYECQCCPGYIGPHCEERDDCNPSPCLNNGICVDLTQTLNGANYHCLCPYGFTGRKCEKDPCFSAPCSNGGSCMSMAMNGSTTFHCACADGWTGAHCDLSVAGGVCASNPCVNGICIEQTDEDVTGELYRCFCQPGYTGDHCEMEYNECESTPCINGGTCTDRVGGFTCSCGRGYTGATCQKKVDLCSPMPCNEKQFCVDHGNTYTCECPHGYVGEECHLPARSICDNNPCAHGGTCWSDVDSFYCSCRPGYTGKLCEEDFILESVVSGEEFEEPRGGGSVRESHLPLGLYHDRLHNVYIAAGTLGAAIAIVGVVVTACHCRVNKTYSRLLSRLTRAADSGPSHHWLEDKRAPSLAPFPPSSGLDTTDMYYTLDFSDSQSSPLIQ